MNFLQHFGAQAQKPTRFAPIWTAEYFTGLYTNRSPFLDGGSRAEKLYFGPRADALTANSLNVEVTTRLTLARRPGTSVWNSQTWNAPDAFYDFRKFSTDSESISVMVDQADALYDGANNGKLAIWQKSAGSGQSYMQSVGNTLFWGDGVDQKKWLQSKLAWKANTIFSAASANGTLGDWIVDPNHNIQVAVGGFTLLISNVAIANNVLTLTLDTAQLADPAGTPSGTASATGGTIPAGSNYIRIAGVDANGNLTEAGNESAAVVTSGSASSIAWSWTPISGAVSYRIYAGTTPGGETHYFTSTVPSFLQTARATSGALGTPPTFNGTSVSVPENLYRMIGVQLALSGLTTATFLNGQVITIASVLPGGVTSNQITATFVSADYPSAPDTGIANSGTGITGSGQPTWATATNAVTQDGGAQWINRGYYVENWGLAAPVSAPSLSQTAAPAIFPNWQANTFYWPSHCTYVVVGGTGYIFLLTRGGITGPTPPAWGIGAIGNQTPDNTAIWTFEGPAQWVASTTYPKNSYTTFTPAGGTMQVYISLNAGLSGTSQATWTGGVGTLVIDNGITWKCLGTIIPYVFTGISTTLPLQQWPTTGSLSFRTSFAITPPPGVALYSTATPNNFVTGGTAVISGCANAALNGTGVTLAPVPTPPFTAGYGFEVTGISPGTYHPWNDMVGGQVVYTPPGQGLTPSVPVALNDRIIDSNGFIEQIQDPGGFSGASAPTWAGEGSLTQESLTATITAFSITSGVATVTANNKFFVRAGMTVTVAGMVAGSYLNGTWPLLAATATTFTFATTHANVTSTTDVGTATVPEGAVWLNLGPYAPASTAAKKYGYAYKNSIDDTVSNMSPLSAGILQTADFFTTVEGFGSPDPQSDTIVIYATDQGGAIPFELDEIRDPGPGVQWSYTDSTGDAGLNIEEQAAYKGENTPPPAGIGALTYHIGRLFGRVNNTVYWSSGTDTPTGNGLNGFNPNNYAIFPSTVERLVPLSTGLFVFTLSDIYIIYGSATTNSPLTPLPYAFAVGLGNYNALDVNGGVIYFNTTDRQLVSLDPNNGLTEIGFPIGDQFQNAPWSPSTSYVTWHIAGTRDKALFVSDGIGDWFRMAPTAAPEQGLTWSPKATIVGGAKAVQSIETTPGVHQLLIGPSGSGPILARDWNTYADNGTAYPAHFTIGSLVLVHPGQIAELAYLTIDSVATGKPLVPSVLIDEVSGVFEEMPRSVPDPPQLAQSSTLYSNRHYFSQTDKPAVCRHMQLRVDWLAENAANEILSSTIYGGFLQEK